MDAETRQVLAAAKGLVANRWGQGDGRTPPSELYGPGVVCLVTALSRATGSNSADYRPAAEALAAVLGIDPGALHVWNDAPGRTQAEVVALFDRALTGVVEAHRVEAIT
jgi:hypothetical protein